MNTDQSYQKYWCEEDSHFKYSYFEEFNSWLDCAEDDEAIEIIDEYNIGAFPNPSKAFYAGDYEGYEMGFKKFRTKFQNDAFSKQFIVNEFDDEHWYNRILSRFEDLVRMVDKGTVVPFIGAGVSKNAGYPTWKEHLADQGKTAGISKAVIENFITKGDYEEFIEQIELKRNKDTFTQEIKDTFSKYRSHPVILDHLFRLFDDTYITTNYDKLIESACEGNLVKNVQVLNRDNYGEIVDPNKITVVKLHGDVYNQRGCILSKEQYDNAYGKEDVNLSLPIPSLLKYYFLNSNLLFIGCSLNNDRTIDVFKTIKKSLSSEENIPQHYSIEQLPPSIQELENRNSYLADLGIAGIWFEPENFDLISKMLELIKIELNFQKASLDIVPGVERGSENTDKQEVNNNKLSMIATLINYLKNL
jgi:NAD-dependent SIR2 family protein deacetylase